MAGRIAGITIEIGGDTTNLQKSLKGVDSSLKSTQSQLKDVNRLLKLDPTNTDLLRQKQGLLKDAVSQTEDRLNKLKDAQAAMDASGIDKSSSEYQALQREILETENALNEAKSAADNFHPALEKIKASADKAADGLQKASDKTKALSTAAAGLLASLAGIGYSAVTSADDLNTLSKQTGFTTEELQMMQYAADRIDVSMEDITGAMKKFKTKIDPSNKALQQLGVTVTEANGELRYGTDVFWDAIEALSGIENETERDQLAMELFGKSADSLAGIIDDGGQALFEYGQEAEDLGLILGQDTLDELNATNDTIDTMKAQIAGIVAVVGSKVVPVVAPIIEQIGTLITNVAEKISNLSPETMKIIMIVLAAVAALSPLLGMLASLATAIGFLASPIGIVIAIIGALVAAGVWLYTHWDTVKEKASELGDHMKTSWENIKTAISDAINNAKTTVTTVFNNIRTKISTTISRIKTNVTTTFENIKTAITSPFEAAKTAVENAIQTIKDLFPLKLGKIFDGIKLPHFKIDGGEIPWGVGGLGKAPSVSIEWYKKAMNQPYLLDGATIFGSMNGKLLGGGESGKEVVLGLDKLKEIASPGATDVSVTVVLQGDAKQLFKVVNQTNKIRTRATNYNVLAGA